MGGYAPGLDEMRAYRPYRPIGVVQPPSGFPGSRYAGLTCGVIAGHKAFAIVGREKPRCWDQPAVGRLPRDCPSVDGTSRLSSCRPLCLGGGGVKEESRACEGSSLIAPPPKRACPAGEKPYMNALIRRPQKPVAPGRCRRAAGWPSRCARACWPVPRRLCWRRG